MPATSPYVAVHGGDLGADNGQGYEWWMYEDDPTAKSSYWRLPAGIVVGLRHSQTQAKRTDITAFGRNPITDGDFGGFTRRYGSDINADKGQGIFWYETTGEYFSEAEWGLADGLPMGTVLGLQYGKPSDSAPVYWKGTAYYPMAAMNAPTPEGFKRRHGGDIGAAKDEGYYWFEKVYGPSPFGKADDIHCTW